MSETSERERPERDAEGLTAEQRLQQQDAIDTANPPPDDKPAAEAEAEPEPEAPTRRTARDKDEDKAEDEKTPAA